MPFVNIFILKGKSPDYVKSVADSINSAVIETMGFPPDDRSLSGDPATRSGVPTIARTYRRSRDHAPGHARWSLEPLKTGLLPEGGGEPRG
jgi:hypothetical protein